MGLIRLDKKYDEFYSFGCSFTTGYIEGWNKSWGYYLSEKLNAKPIVQARNGSGNFTLMMDVLTICEMNKNKNIAIGIQLTERNRREIWVNDKNVYNSFNYATLTLNSKKELDKELHIFSDYVNELSPLLFNDFENYIRTLTSIMMIKNYLENNKIDYVIFEGMVAISDYKDFQKNAPQNLELFVKDDFVTPILESNTFFKKYGPMQPFCRTHELYDVNKNGGHPNSEFIKWWVDEMYEQIKNNQ
jgi:hypothetical protein